MIKAVEERGSATKTVELRFSARPENLALARLALAGVAETVGANESVVADLKVAVTETCTNAIQHAYRDSPEQGEIVVRYTIGAGSIRVEVEDSGNGFDPLPDDPGPNGRNAGMGLIIVSALTDELTIESAQPGARVSFVKWLP